MILPKKFEDLVDLPEEEQLLRLWNERLTKLEDTVKRFYHYDRRMENGLKEMSITARQKLIAQLKREKFAITSAKMEHLLCKLSIESMPEIHRHLERRLNKVTGRLDSFINSLKTVDVNLKD